MNDISVSVFLLAIVQLEQYAIKLGYENFAQFSKDMIDVMNLVDRDYSVPYELLYKVRTVQPFLSLSIDQESYIYSIFGKLK